MSRPWAVSAQITKPPMVIMMADQACWYGSQAKFATMLSATMTTQAPVDESEGVPTEAVVVILFGIVLLAVLIGVLIGRSRASPADSDENANGQE